MKKNSLVYGLQKKYIIFTFLTPIVMIGEVFMETLIPWIMALIIDNGIFNYDINYVIKNGSFMILATVFSLLFGAFGGRFSSVASYGFSRNLRFRLFKKIQDFSFSQADFFGTGSLITRLTSDVTNLQNVYQNAIRSMVRAPLMMVFGTVMACFINIRLALIFFISIPLLAFFLALIAVKAYPRFKEMFAKYDLLNTVVQENLIAIRVVKAFVRGDFESEKFEKIAAQVRDSQVKAEKIVIFNAPLMKFVIYMCIIASLWFGGNMVLSERMKTGELISFITYVTQIMMSLMMVSMIFVGFILSRPSFTRVKEILKTDTKENEISAFDSPAVKDGSIEFCKVSFSYDGNPDHRVLKDINLKIESGKTVGIIGGTGSSKTTLVSLIARLYEVSDGILKVGGKQVSQYSLYELRKNIGFVLQKNTLFSGTIAENLRWGCDDADISELENACKIALAHDFVMEFPNGYDTILGQDGVNLSGGQKQRLCLARALLKNPKILIMDDSTSAVDTTTELNISTNLKNSFPLTTKIIIAQRISSVQNVDFIVVLNEGKIDGTGSHAWLLENNKIYREVYESQIGNQ